MRFIVLALGAPLLACESYASAPGSPVESASAPAPSTPSPVMADASTDPNPAWLVGTLTGSRSSLGQNFIDVRSDGTATARTEVSAAGHATSREVKWVFEGPTLVLGGDRYAFAVAASCHLVQLAGSGSLADVFTLRSDLPIDGCPQTERALTERETLLLGNWSGSQYLLGFRIDRHVSVSSALGDYDLRFALDPDGHSFEFTRPDGSDAMHGTLTTQGKSMTLCVTGEEACQALTRQ